MEEYIQVLTTTETKEDAKKIAKELVERRLAACIQISGPITSVFRWDENIQEESEWRITIKTGYDLYEDLEKVLEGIHPYEVPEIVALPLIRGSEKYFEWMKNELD